MTLPLQAVRTGLIAGLAGGFLLEAFLTAVPVSEGAPLNATLVGNLQFAAAGAIGKAAFTSPAYAWFGAFVHFVLSIAWATGFAYLAITRRELIRKPLVSGLSFGFLVWLLMQIVLIGAGLYATPTPQSLGIALLAHCVFFGLAVSYVTARLEA